MADLPPATEVAAIPEQNTLSTANDLFIYRRRIAEAPPPEPEISSVTYPSATAHQHLLLDDLNDDVLSLIVDYLFDADELNGKYKYLYTNEGPYFRTHRSTLNLSVVNRRLRAVCVRKLFRDVHRCSESMGQLNRQLKDIELDAVLLGSIRTCEIVTSSRRDSTLCKTRFPKVQSAMPHLRELSITHRKNFDFTALEVTFTKSNVVLPTVIGLRIQCPGDWYFLVKICPNTERLILRDNLNCQTMMAVVGSLQKLQHLELFDKCWNEDDIDKLCNLVPNIESLSLKGNILVGSSNVEEWGEAFGQFPHLRTLAITTDPNQLDCDHEHAFSDDSDVAMDIICSRGFYGVNIDLRKMASGYFESVNTLEKLYIWVYSLPLSCYTATRDGNGVLAALRYSQDDAESADCDSIAETLDMDGFPKMLSFPLEIMSCDPKYDPPLYGRGTVAEREAEKARHEEKLWYAERWLRWQPVDSSL